MDYTHIVHPFAPVYGKDSTILILGTLPSIKSRENDFYYGHGRNRFWAVLAALFGAPVPETKEAKKVLLLENRIALWDVIYSCDIRASSDSSIKNVEPTDLSVIFASAEIKRVFANGVKAGALYRRYQRAITGREITVLPSTSPANAAWPFEKLCRVWQEILK